MPANHLVSLVLADLLVRPLVLVDQIVQRFVVFPLSDEIIVFDEIAIKLRSEANFLFLALAEVESGHLLL